VLPLLLLIIVGMIDFGFVFREFNVVTNAAREGARAGILPDYGDDANVANRIEQYLKASGIDVECPSAECVVNSPVVAVAAPTGTFSARQVSVVVFHDWTFLAPIASMFGGSFTSVALTGRAVMRLE
jgi:Flp pilus assembly protein TadG